MAKFINQNLPVKPKNGKGNSKTLKVGAGNKKPSPIKGGKK